jgi:YggT family protein
VIRTVLVDLIWLYILVLFARAVLSWFPAPPGSALQRVIMVLDRLTEPVLAPVRRLIPPVRIGGGGIDLSIMLVLFALFILIRVIAA